MSNQNGESSEISFWRGPFGDDYMGRNPPDERRIRAVAEVMTKILSRVEQDPPRSIAEIGPNIGINLRALARVSDAALWGVEPNDRARAKLVTDGVLPSERILAGTAQTNPLSDASIDLIFTSGVLIHIAPHDLAAACQGIHRAARKYVLAIEYFSDRPEELVYRGHSARLFKRDFGLFWLENFPDLTIIDYGFIWRPATGLDNMNWWLFRKLG